MFVVWLGWCLVICDFWNEFVYGVKCVVIDFIDYFSGFVGLGYVLLNFFMNCFCLDFDCIVEVFWVDNGMLCIKFVFWVFFCVF